MRAETVYLSRKAYALALALVAVFVLTMALAVRAEALPVGFWGVVPQATPTAEQVQRLGRGGVESIRAPFEWSALEPTANGPIQWAGPDEIVESATEAGVSVLPVLTGAPSWAVANVRVPGASATAPAHLPVSGAGALAWSSLLKQAVERYGPGGEFWTLHPSLSPRPIRAWQIWNEPNFKYFDAHPNPTEYGRLVTASYGALKAADPGASVILAGLFAQPGGARTARGKHTSPNWFASDFLERMYKTTPGVKTKFAGVALHPYTYDYRHLPSQIEEVRKVLSRFHDGRKGLWLTELGWSSQPPTRGNSFAKGPSGQVTQLNGAFRLLERKQRPWNLRAVYWFSVDDLAGVCNFCSGTGLFGTGFKPKRSWFAYVKFAGGTP